MSAHAGGSGGGWERLAREVDAWRAASREAALWWRDDDAVRPSPALERLLSLRPGCPLGLAVIPAKAEPALADALPEAVDVLVHGHAHANHARAGERSSEYPDARTGGEEELRAGRERLEAAFGARALPVFVPPWNRMGRAAAAALPDAGYEAVSGYRGRPEAPLPRLDTHVDIVDWRGGRRFVGAEAALGALADALAERRRTGDARPAGLLTHHLVHDEPAWRFLDELLAWTAETPGVRWVRPRAALGGLAAPAPAASAAAGCAAGSALPRPPSRPPGRDGARRRRP